MLDMPFNKQRQQSNWIHYKWSYKFYLPSEHVADELLADVSFSAGIDLEG